MDLRIQRERKRSLKISEQQEAELQRIEARPEVHRACMLATLFIGLIGVAMVFIGHAHEYNPRGLIHLGTHHPVTTAHFTIGLTIVLLQVINPILATIRCHEGGKWRWVFNLVHGSSIGIGAAILAFVNVGLGTYIFDDGVSNIFLVYVGYVSFMAILPYILRAMLKLATVYMCNFSYTPLNTSETVKVTYGSTNRVGQSSTNRQEGESTRKPSQPTKDSPIRWVVLVLYFGVTTPLVMTMVILAAAGPINT